MSRAGGVGPPLLTGLVVAAVVCTQAGDARAQSAFSIGAGLGSFMGADFSGTPAGPIIGAGYHLPFEDDATEIGLGVEYSRYGGHGFVGATMQMDYAGTIRRRVVAGPSELWVGAKYGYSTRSLSVVEEPARTDGFLIGPSLSLRVPVARGASMDLSLDLAYYAYEELIMYASREYGTDQDGLRVVLRMGFMVPASRGGQGDDRSAPGRR